GDWELLSSARRAGRMARCARPLGSLHQEVLQVARRAASSGASRTFIVHLVRRAEWLARRAVAKTI
ncbi:hypothetical protein A2U01_0108795, partial [Trifolium medium]|nr:hypothetical protein [Trifolium medium]